MTRQGDNRGASPATAGEREQPSHTATLPALTSAHRRAVRTHAQQRSWLHQAAVRCLGPGKHTQAAMRASIKAILAEPPPPPTPRRARGHRGGVKRQSRTAPLSDPVMHVATKSSVPQRAPAIPEHQHAAEASAGKLRAAMRSMHAIQARDAVWRRQRAATAARLPPRDAHVKAWRVARLQAIGEEARAAVRCAEAARDAIELANRELAAARASDRVEILQLRELIETSAVDQAELLRLRELTKTPAFDHAELLRHKAGLVRHKAALDNIYKELGELKCARDKIYTGLNVLESDREGIYEELDGLKASRRSAVDRPPRDTARPRCPSPSRPETASGKTVGDLSARVDRIVMDMGEEWGDKWRCRHTEFKNYR